MKIGCRIHGPFYKILRCMFPARAVRPAASGGEGVSLNPQRNNEDALGRRDAA